MIRNRVPVAPTLVTLALASANAFGAEPPVESQWKDLKDRIRAGDPTVPVATQRILAESDHLRDVSKQVRRTLAGRVKEVSALRTRVADELKHVRGKKIGVTYRTVTLSKEARNRLLLRLR